MEIVLLQMFAVVIWVSMELLVHHVLEITMDRHADLAQAVLQSEVDVSMEKPEMELVNVILDSKEHFAILVSQLIMDQVVFKFQQSNTLDLLLEPIWEEQSSPLSDKTCKTQLINAESMVFWLTQLGLAQLV